MLNFFRKVPLHPFKRLLTLTKENTYVAFTPPMVRTEPSGFDLNKIIDKGFIIAQTTVVNSEHMDGYTPIIQKFINDQSKEVSYDRPLLIFKENHNQQELIENLYNAYGHMQGGDDALVISYWAQYEGQIIWSKAVSITLIHK